jgi:hypothetical protein
MAILFFLSMLFNDYNFVVLLLNNSVMQRSFWVNIAGIIL